MLFLMIFAWGFSSYLKGLEGNLGVWQSCKAKGPGWMTVAECWERLLRVRGVQGKNGDSRVRWVGTLKSGSDRGRGFERGAGLAEQCGEARVV